MPAEQVEDALHTCPRCHRPLEGDESYVCCAGVELRWRCADCHKVSEGFAFPYGMCPHCSGKLELLERGRVEDDQGQEAIRTAFEVELGGHAFYSRAARDASDPYLRELFGKFAAMEREHMATLSKRYHADLPQADERFQIDRAAIFAGIERRPEDPGNLFRIAIAFEERAVKYFSERAGTFAGTVAGDLYKELAAEEREHVEILTTEFERWKSGKAGML